MVRERLILGGGVTGLAAGIASGLPVFEAVETPGGICSSYYVRPGDAERLSRNPADGETYHFEIGGGHWIFGGDPSVLRFIRKLTDVETYARRSSVYFPETELYVPYPLQNHLRFLNHGAAERALAEMALPKSAIRTMREWMEQSFGSTLCEMFFFPFHELYTSSLYKRIAPQDDYKSPVDLAIAIRGAFKDAASVGYNVTYVYPKEGLNTLAGRMAERCDVRYGKRVSQIDIENRAVLFSDGGSLPYESLISTLPLNKMLELTGLAVDCEPDPYTSVLVLNIGAVRGKKCPDDHWLYVANTSSGFHRVGFYSNVDRSFLPMSARSNQDRVSIYVERAYANGQRPSKAEVERYSNEVVSELQQWGFIGEVEVNDPTWIDVAYTWSWPGSQWKPRALKLLEENDISQVGRYGRWVFQGIADSIRDGFFVGASLKDHQPIGTSSISTNV
ncbi:MAG TPA: FAD-dependent oxidoreductase [Blastocatellia bacterium]|nr:FAD-dependent oxidoreductase [Blastocatellia bacterium]